MAEPTNEYALVPGIYEVTYINMMLKFLPPKEVKVNITIDDIRLKSNLTSKKKTKFTRKSFLYIILIFTQSHSGELGDIGGFVQLIPGTYKNDKPVKITGIDEVHFKCDCIDGSFGNGTREPISYSFSLTSPPAVKFVINQN